MVAWRVPAELSQLRRLALRRSTDVVSVDLSAFPALESVNLAGCERLAVVSLGHPSTVLTHVNLSNSGPAYVASTRVNESTSAPAPLLTWDAPAALDSTWLRGGGGACSATRSVPLSWLGGCANMSSLQLNGAFAGRASSGGG